jgi:hypothetical protein
MSDYDNPAMRAVLDWFEANPQRSYHLRIAGDVITIYRRLTAEMIEALGWPTANVGVYPIKIASPNAETIAMLKTAQNDDAKLGAAWRHFFDYEQKQEPRRQ